MLACCSPSLIMNMKDLFISHSLAIRLFPSFIIRRGRTSSTPLNRCHTQSVCEQINTS